MYPTPQLLRQWAAEDHPHYGAPSNIRRIRAEQAAARALLRRILKAGYSVRVHDGEEFHPLTASESVAWDALGNVDEENLVVIDTSAADHVRVGRLFLVWGNGGDELVSDYAWNERVEGSEAIMKRLAGY